MTLPAHVRIFFAITPPKNIVEQLNSLIAQLKKQSKTNAIRWTKSENLHITLQFLAEVKSEHLPSLIDNVKKQIMNVELPPEIHLSTPRVFPNPYRPRVIVLELTPQNYLDNLSQLIGRGITATQYPSEDRPFRGHLTLGRIKYFKGLNLNFLSEFTASNIDAVHFNEVILFRSEPQTEGSKYTIIEKIVLGQISFLRHKGLSRT